jgi:aryl-alcohol dehydrogenase-like predicted oxidoreductase
VKYRLLGKCELPVSEAALGIMTFGDDPEPNPLFTHRSPSSSQ